MQLLLSLTIGVGACAGTGTAGCRIPAARTLGYGCGSFTWSATECQWPLGVATVIDGVRGVCCLVMDAGPAGTAWDVRGEGM